MRPKPLIASFTVIASPFDQMRMIPKMRAWGRLSTLRQGAKKYQYNKKSGLKEKKY
jgi:hypothetical protein